MDIGDQIIYIELVEKFACPLVAALPETGLDSAPAITLWPRAGILRVVGAEGKTCFKSVVRRCDVLKKG